MKIATDNWCVINGDHASRQTLTELFDSMPAGPALCTYMQYSVTCRSILEAACDAISDTALEDVGRDVRVNLDCSRSIRSWGIRPAHIVQTNDDERRITRLVVKSDRPIVGTSKPLFFNH